MPPSSPPRRACSVELTCDLSAPRTARHLASLVLRQWGVGDQDLVDAVTIVVSELVSNVLVHCDDGGPLRVGLELLDEHVRVVVEDRTPAVPIQRVAAPGDEGGRGLGIVAQLAVHVEVQPVDEGKQVVVDLPLPTAQSA